MLAWHGVQGNYIQCLTLRSAQLLYGYYIQGLIVDSVQLLFDLVQVCLEYLD